jgi:enoyl-CoA hydratase/carnithine racemase
MTVKTNLEAAILTVTLNRPASLNAFNPQLMDDLADAFLDAASDSKVKVLILTGEGRAFSAGADLSAMGRPLDPPKHGLAGLLDAIVDFPKPFLLAVNGIGVGIGATICGLADFTYISEKARLRCPFSALGLTAEAGSTHSFPQLMGRQKANWFLLAAEWMSAAECVESGLALEMLPEDKLLDRVNEQAAKLAALPSSSVMKTKALMMAPHRDSLKAHIIKENEGLAELSGSPANREAITAFLEKREADFSGME